jgi:hypothetical protein
MKSFKYAKWAIAAATALAVMLAFTSLPTSARGPKSSTTDDPDLLELSAIWWQWIYSIPVSKNPGFDATGQFARNGQPGDEVMFLAGSFVSGPFTRTITVPRGTALFFPVAVAEWDNIGLAPKDQLTIPELRAVATEVLDESTDLHAALDGQPLSMMRLTSPVFSYHLPKKGNIYQYFDQDVTGTIAPAVSDGYWVYIPSLRKGNHTLTFGSTVPGNGMGQPDFVIDLTYHITVR